MDPLCNTGDLRAWLTIDPGVSDPLLQRSRDSASADFLRVIDRPTDFGAADYVEVVSGDDTPTLVLRHWPVNAVTSITDQDGNVLTHSADGIAAGWWLHPETDPERLCSIILVPSATGETPQTPTNFAEGTKYSVVYNAGYVAPAVVDELANIAANPGPYTITPSQAVDWLSDSGVKFVIGNVPLVKVAANPAAGQYAVSDEGVYTFAAADTGLGVKISYKLLAAPKDVRQAIIDLASYRYRGRQFIGQTSKHMQTGETVTFENVEMPLSTAGVAKRYRRDLVRMA